MRCIVVGTVAALKTRAAALQRIEVLRANVNREIIETGSSTVTTFKSLIEHYREREMRMDNHDKKAYSTKKRNESYLRKWIVPRWGQHRPSDIKSVAVEEWLEKLSNDTGKNKGKPLAGGTKIKIRNIMSAVFRHGMRHELLPRVEAANPMKYVRQSGKRQSIPMVLEVEQFQSLFGTLRQRERTMVLLDCGSGLRCGELIGLQWWDIDFFSKTDECHSVGCRDGFRQGENGGVPKDCASGRLHDRRIVGLVQNHAVQETGGLGVCHRLTSRRGEKGQAAVLANDNHADVHQTGSEKAGHRQHQLAHVPPYVLEPLARQRRRPQSGAGAPAALFHQNHDGHLHAGCVLCETESPVESSGADRSEAQA
jgi:hypothetical protein